MKTLLAFLLLAMHAMAFAHYKNVPTQADRKARALFSERRQHPWPFPLLSIGHNMQSFQDYGGSPYWHDGLDIRSRADQPIFAAAGGKVVNLENYQRGNPLYWEVAILDEEGFVWKYHHVAKESIPADIQEGKFVKAGALIGNVVRWPISSFGETYHHLHLLIVGKDGKYINPFLMMEDLLDTQAPVIHKIGLAQGHRPINGSEVKGEHALYLEATDLTLHEKFILPPHKITYKIDEGPEKVVWEFIHLPSATNDTDYINDFYMKGTCGNYQCRKFYFNLNFTPSNPRGTLKLPAGKHNIEVTIEDVVGNKSSADFEWSVL